MKPNLRLATLMLLGALPIAGISADYGSSSSSSTSSSQPSGSMGTPGSSRDTATSPGSTTGSTATDSSGGAMGRSDTTGSMGRSADTTGSQAGVPDDFRRLDKNHDGLLSKREARKDKQAKSNFKAWDTDGDGKLSLSEWQAAHGTGAAGVSGASRGDTSQSGQSGQSDMQQPGLQAPDTRMNQPSTSGTGSSQY